MNPSLRSILLTCLSFKKKVSSSRLPENPPRISPSVNAPNRDLCNKARPRSGRPLRRRPAPGSAWARNLKLSDCSTRTWPSLTSPACTAAASPRSERSRGRGESSSSTRRVVRARHRPRAREGLGYRRYATLLFVVAWHLAPLPFLSFPPGYTVDFCQQVPMPPKKVFLLHRTMHEHGR